MVEGTPLGKHTAYPDRYAPELLCPIARAAGREELGLHEPLPFRGADLWNAYEVSWLNEQGKPLIATAQLRVPATSPYLIESKSLKLYLGSLHSTRLPSKEDVCDRVRADLERALQAEVRLRLTEVARGGVPPMVTPEGICIDDMPIEPTAKQVDETLLEGCTDPALHVDETLFSHLLRSNCPVTGQPDWATVFLRYRGPRIEPSAFLRYVISFRHHNEFHEQCVERIFVHVQRRCAPEALTVYARFTRRGGIDINPFRSNFEEAPEDIRLWRQ